jgi:cholesterol oxidase
MSLLKGDPPDEAEVVVVGSGFGGSVVAQRLAAEGVDVCVLERGKAYPPGSFPRTPAGIAANFWDPSEGRYGMFDVWSFTGLDAVTASGLGGGSLIYANVLLRKDPSWFRQPHPYRPGQVETWPIGYDDLEPHYERVERFLDVQEMPFNGDANGHPDFDIRKTAAMKQAAANTRGTFNMAPLAVRFRDADGRPAVRAEIPVGDYPNIHRPLGPGSGRRTCGLLGECDVGCNDGAKSSLDHTYLSSASHRGASIHVHTQVLGLARRPDGRFDVTVAVHEPTRDGPPRPTATLPTHTIVARRLVLSAGTLGSTYLMLASRDQLGVTSKALGTRFCGNGDLLGFIMRAKQALQGTHGPVISSYIRYPSGVETGDPLDHGMYIEDAGYPAIAAWLAELTQSPAMTGRLARLVAQRTASKLTGRRRTSLSSDLSRVLGPGRFSDDSLPLLGMGLDVPDGTLYLRNPDDSPVLDSTWTTRTSQQYFRTMKARMAALAEELGGKFEVNPSFLFNRVVTVHALGGVPMSTSARDGVVDAHGRVHDVPGMRVCDGSVMPGPVGANPSLTIAAFADRVADNLLEEISA